jgi:hypothetical protein
VDSLPGIWQSHIYLPQAEINLHELQLTEGRREKENDMRIQSNIRTYNFKEARIILHWKALLKLYSIRKWRRLVELNFSVKEGAKDSV